ncbi:MAG: transposase [Myxococcales bacterium]|nr:transposase [Myxococcales bacterium]
MGYDRRLCVDLMGAFASELSRSYRRRAKRALGLSSVSDALTGAVTFVQRFDSALRLHPHAHTLVLDGVYVRDGDGVLEFHALPEPTVAEVTSVAAATAARIERVLQAHGRDFDERSDAGDDQLSLDYPALASCYRAATAGQLLLGNRPGQPALRLVGQAPGRKTRGKATLVAEVRGVNVHTQRVVDGRDRKQLERLYRYLARPPLAHDRLAQLPDGRLSLSLKTPWSDGTEAIALSPLDLIARLCALVPPPRMHMTRFFGVLSSANKVRAEVVPTPQPDPELQPPLQLSLLQPDGTAPPPPPSPDPPPRSGRHPWAWLLRHVFKQVRCARGADVERRRQRVPPAPRQSPGQSCSPFFSPLRQRHSVAGSARPNRSNAWGVRVRVGDDGIVHTPRRTAHPLAAAVVPRRPSRRFQQAGEVRTKPPTRHRMWI